MGIQRIVTLISIVVLFAGGFLLLRQYQGETAGLHVCSWSSYLPDSILAEFKKKTGINVRVSLISSNEELFAKLKAGATGYDVIQPSDYMVRQMIDLGMLSPLDHSLLPHKAELEEYYLKLPYDPGLKFSLPFSLGITGLTINTEKIKVDSEGVSWKLLFDSPDPKHTSLLDDMREVFSAALLFEGRLVNSRTLGDWEVARKRIEAAKGKVLLFSSEPKPLLLRKEVYVAHSYSTDGVQASRQDSKLRFFIPKEGAVVWTDNLAIPKTSEKKTEAHQFLDFLMEPDIALKIAQEIYITTPNRTARARLPREYTEDPNLYPPPDLLKKLIYLENPGQILEAVSRMWTELKT